MDVLYLCGKDVVILHQVEQSMSLRLFSVFMCVKFHVFEIFVDHVNGILCTRVQTLKTDIIAQVIELWLQTPTFNTNFRFGPDSV